MNFEELKCEILKRAKEEGACKDEYKRAYKSDTIEELIEVIKDNLSWNNDHDILTIELANKYEQPRVFNNGKNNSGLFNSGDQNSGYQNCGHLNSGHLNSGDQNSGDRNSGDQNSGYQNIGGLNSGDFNCGDLNSGDFNSGYRNSGVFCTRKRSDTIPFFNRESNMTWDEWYIHPAYRVAIRLKLTEWIDWESMTDEEKSANGEAFITGGYLKIYTYHEAWSNLWKNLTEEQKDSFKTLPNYDPDIFEEITGIRFD